MVASINRSTTARFIMYVSVFSSYVVNSKCRFSSTTKYEYKFGRTQKNTIIQTEANTLYKFLPYPNEDFGGKENCLGLVALLPPCNLEFFIAVRV